MKTHYERDDATYPADAYRVRGRWAGVAVYVRGWETTPNEDTEWSGIEERTGWLVVTMVGDDAHHLVDPDDVIPLDRADYCGICGQIGCCHDGLDRDNE